MSKSKPTLRIELSDDTSTYRPGDTVNGYVISEQLADFAKLAPPLRVSMFGSAKTRYILKRQHNSTRERGRASFFDQHQLLHSGRVRGDGQNA